MTPAPWTLDLPNLTATQALGRWLGETAKRGDCLLLSGDLGAGKTSLAQGLAAGLGVTESVTSPTFTLLNEYRARLPLYHIDLYRLEPAEVVGIGLAEYWLEPRGLTVIEWPERLPEPLLPEEFLTLTLTISPDDARLASVTAEGRRSTQWLTEVQALAARH
jgi:tRNA threonylcarbamoyladenosine biosynthesis protein TsaE